MPDAQNLIAQAILDMFSIMNDPDVSDSTFRSLVQLIVDHGVKVQLVDGQAHVNIDEVIGGVVLPIGVLVEQLAAARGVDRDVVLTDLRASLSA